MDHYASSTMVNGSASSFNTVTSAGGGKGSYNTSRPTELVLMVVQVEVQTQEQAHLGNGFLVVLVILRLQIHHSQMVVMEQFSGSTPNADKVVVEQLVQELMVLVV